MSYVAELERQVRELETKLSEAREAGERDRRDAEFGKWCRLTLAECGPIKTVSGKDVYTFVLPLR